MPYMHVRPATVPALRRPTFGRSPSSAFTFVSLLHLLTCSTLKVLPPERPMQAAGSDFYSNVTRSLVCPRRSPMGTIHDCASLPGKTSPSPSPRIAFQPLPTWPSSSCVCIFCQANTSWCIASRRAMANVDWPKPTRLVFLYAAMLAVLETQPDETCAIYSTNVPSTDFRSISLGSRHGFLWDRKCYFSSFWCARTSRGPRLD